MIGGQTGAIRRVEGRRREMLEQNPIQVSIPPRIASTGQVCQTEEKINIQDINLNMGNFRKIKLVSELIWLFYG